MITFGPLVTSAHPAADGYGEDAMPACKNLDRQQEGRAGPRGGLQRPDTWNGILGKPGTLQTGARYVGNSDYGKPLRYLIPNDATLTAAPAITFDEGS